MPARKVAAILTSSFRKMDSSGSFYQFTYGMGCPVPRRILDHLGLQALRTGGTLPNLPPASVYRIQRKPAPFSQSRPDTEAP
jgi:phospholipid N-methyltransferase